MIRFATIGTNFITDWFLEGVKYCDNLEYKAVYSRSEESGRAFAAKYGVSACYTNLQELAEAQDIDAVYIASPNSLHCGQAVLLMEHGKHVLVEKPAASNAEELRQMLSVAQKHQVVLLEGLKSVFAPGFQAIREHLHKLGTVRRASFQFAKYSSRYDNFKKGIIENAFKPELSNGALMDIGVYCVHPMVKLFGRPEEIKADALFLHNGIDGAGSIFLKYQDMQADVLYSKITSDILPDQIQGEEATMVIRNIYDTRELEIHYRNGAQEVIQIEKQPQMMEHEAREWASLIESRASAKEHNQASLIAMEIMDEARRQTGLIFPADRNGGRL